MRIRTLTISAVCAVALAIVTGCSSEVAGTATMPSGAVGQAGGHGSGTADDAPADTQDDAAADDAIDGADGTPADAGDSPGAGTDDSGASPTSPNLDDILEQLGDGSGAPGDMGDLGDLGDLSSLLGQAGADGSLPIPGLGPGCLALAGVALAAGFALLGPAMGGVPLTESDVNDMFEDISGIPPEVQPQVQKVHQMLLGVVGKSGEEVNRVLDSDEYNDAMDSLSDYMDAQCGGS